MEKVKIIATIKPPTYEEGMSFEECFEFDFAELTIEANGEQVYTGDTWHNDPREFLDAIELLISISPEHYDYIKVIKQSE